jgi:hypothetical protein
LYPDEAAIDVTPAAGGYQITMSARLRSGGGRRCGFW